MEREDHYTVLGVAPAASEREIKRAYRRLAVQFHPDQRPSRIADMLMRRLTEAYEVLSDPERRKAYDAERAATMRARAPRRAQKEEAPVDHRRLGRRLDEHRRERAREAERIGRRTVGAHGASMASLALEYDAEKAPDRRGRAARLLTFVWLALLLAGLVVLLAALLL